MELHVLKLIRVNYYDKLIVWLLVVCDSMRQLRKWMQLER